MITFLRFRLSEAVLHCSNTVLGMLQRLSRGLDIYSAGNQQAKFLVHTELDFSDKMTNGLISIRHKTEESLRGDESLYSVIQPCNLIIIILIIPFFCDM